MQERCGAKTRDGDPCRNWGMKNGRCRMHGGKSTGRPIITGRYSLKHREALQKKVSHFAEDPQPANLRGELDLMRAMLQDYLDRFPENLPNINIEARKNMFWMLSEISKLVERISRIINSSALTAAEIQFIERRLPDLLMEYIDDPNQRLQFLEQLFRPSETQGLYAPNLIDAAGAEGIGENS